MDNPDFKNPAVPNLDRPIPLNDDLDKPIPLDDLDKPIPFDNVAPSKANVSHAPLNLGGPPAAVRAAAPAPARAAAPAAQIRMPKGAVTKAAAQVASSERITGMKTFFTKLHGGAILFLEEQIANWLKDNPAVIIKRTNITTGDVQGKKTEPNIIITVWY